LEGTNNKIKTLQKQAYGFRDTNFFKLKIYALHETKYALVGWTVFGGQRTAANNEADAGQYKQ